jgi:hypothetical protein
MAQGKKPLTPPCVRGRYHKEEEAQKVIEKRRGFKKRDFDVKLGSVLLPIIKAPCFHHAAVPGSH